MKILIVSQYFRPENFRINDVAEGLAERGHEVTVLTGMPNYTTGRFAPGYGWFGPYSESFGAVRVVRVPLLPRGRGNSFRLACNYLSYAASACLFGARRCRGEYDAILVHQMSPATVGIPARFLSWLKGAPILFWVQDLWPESLSAAGAVRSPGILAAVGWAMRWIYRGCDRVLAQSEAFFAPIAAQGVPEDRIRFLANSAEELYHPLPPRGSWNGPPLPAGFRVMFAGNVGASQSLETVLAAAERLRTDTDIHWVIVGDGRAMSHLHEEVARRDLAACVHLMGRHPIETMPEWFAQADVMLVTLRREPIFALTIPSRVQSYMACARPIIAALDGEGARIVEEAGAGVGVPAENSEALAQAVLRFYQMPASERQAMGDSGYAYFLQHFTREVLLDRLEGFIEELVGERK